MKNHKFFILTIILFTLTSMGTASYCFAQNANIPMNNKLKAIAENTNSISVIKIKKELNYTDGSDFLKKFGASLASMEELDNPILISVTNDELGMKHEKYAQVYKGLTVETGEAILHFRNGRIQSVTNGFRKIDNVSGSRNISGMAAVSIAKNSYSASTIFANEISSLEIAYKERMHDATVSYAPKPSYIYIPIVEKSEGVDLKLCVTFSLTDAQLVGWKYYIDAISGDILKVLPLNYNCSAGGGVTIFYGNRTISTRQVPSSNPAKWNLWNDCNTYYIHTKLWKPILANSTEYETLNNSGWSIHNSALTSHWTLERTVAYYKNVFNRNGWNGANAGIDLYHEALFCYTANCTPTSSNNASFGNGVCKVGIGDTSSVTDDWNSLDILGHEMTHGVTESSANLVYSKEPGALNESFSDIFGVSIYDYSLGYNNDIWKVGFDRKKVTNNAISLYIRNMESPNDKGDPDTYLGTNWFSTTTPPPAADSSNDGWGVHTNSGVQNFMYYLLVVGGSGINDNGDNFNVTGIGFDAAQRIAYKTLTSHLTTNSQYLDARNAWILSAEELYGECSAQAIAVAKSWYAVGADKASYFYNVTAATCTNSNTNAGPKYDNAINSRLIYAAYPACTPIFYTASNYLYYFQAGNYIKVSNGTVLQSTGTQPLILFTGDCAYSMY